MPNSTFNPCITYTDADARVQQLCAQDDDTIHPVSKTRVWSYGSQTERVVLYLHGYTDSVQQFAPLGEQLYANGYNVFAPRLPYHGYKDRMTADHSNLTVPQMVEWTNAAIDIARGLGDKVSIIGLSLGGVLATWAAENRADADSVVIVSPAYGTSAIPPRLTPAAARLFRHLPNMFMWWDPRVGEKAGFEYTYPRFSTRTLAHAFGLGAELLQTARRQVPAARQVWMVTNANDFAVNNALCDEFVRAWQTHDPARIHTYQFPKELGLPHDVMDAADPLTKPDVVYPRLIEIIQSA